MILVAGARRCERAYHVWRNAGLYGLRYGIPMPVQPLKPMATLVIAQKIRRRRPLWCWPGDWRDYVGSHGDGFDRMAGACRSENRGAGNSSSASVCQLAMLAVRITCRRRARRGTCWRPSGSITIVLLGNRRFPAALFVIALGVTYAFIFKVNFDVVWRGASFHLPQWRMVERDRIC